MADIYVKSGGGSANSGTYRGEWLATTAFATGDRVISTTVSSYRIHECTTAGTSGGSAPTFSTVNGGTTSDGTVTWTTRIPSTWANATVSLVRAAANDANGDTIWVSHQHAETTAAGIQPLFAGTAASPVRVICADDTSGEPPTTLAATGSVAVTGASNMVVVPIYCYGIQFSVADGSNSGLFNAGGGAAQHAFYENCKITLNTTSTAARIVTGVGNVANGLTTFKDCTFKFGSTSQGITTASGRVFIQGGSVDGAGSTPTGFIANLASGSQYGTPVILNGVDFSGLSTGFDLFADGGRAGGVAYNCKFPASWSGSVYSGNPTNLTRYELYNSDSADTNYRTIIKEATGTLVTDTGIYNNAGATDGTTRLSWKLTTTANCSFHASFRTPEIVRWNATTGSAITVTLETVLDSATALKDDEVWVEVLYMGTSGVPLGTWITDARTLLGTAADQTSSAASWTTTGMSNPTTQKLAVTFTPQEAGFVHARVRLGKASTTVYVDPKLTIS